MPSLADWMKQLVIQPVDELDQKYTSSVDFLLKATPNSVVVEDVPDKIVRAFHSKIRERACEAPLWDAVLFCLRAPLPSEVAHDLIDRDVVVSQLGHTRQKDEVQWRLASLVDEALLTFVRDMFTQPLYTAAELERLLAQHPVHFWLLDKWEHWALLSSKVRDEEKEVVFHLWAWQHPKDADGRVIDVPTPEWYLEILAARKQEQLRAQQEKEEERWREEQDVEQRRIELQHLSQRPLAQEEIQGMFLVQSPDELLALASNIHLPISWLQKLLNCHSIKGARKIREAAQENFETRSSGCE